MSLTRRMLLKTGIVLPEICASEWQGDAPNADPWPASNLMEPATLAQVLRLGGARPIILCVAFPVLYRQRHITGAQLAGPGSKPEGLADLKKVLRTLPLTTDLVLYCGCCPMVHCPNIRPAYKIAADLGYSNLHALNLPTSFHADWSAKGYPVEPNPNG